MSQESISLDEKESQLPGHSVFKTSLIMWPHVKKFKIFKRVWLKKYLDVFTPMLRIFSPCITRLKCILCRITYKNSTCIRMIRKDVIGVFVQHLFL